VGEIPLRGRVALSLSRGETARQSTDWPPTGRIAANVQSGKQLASTRLSQGFSCHHATTMKTLLPHLGPLGPARAVSQWCLSWSD